MSNVINLNDSDFSFESQNEEVRIVRKSFSFEGQSKINVYEPTEMDIKEIKKLIKDKGSYQFNTKEVFDALIHRFTNLDFSNVSELVRYKLMENPPVYLKMVITEITNIVSDIVILYHEDTKALIKQIGVITDSMELIRLSKAMEDTNKINQTDVDGLKKQFESIKNSDIIDEESVKELIESYNKVK